MYIGITVHVNESPTRASFCVNPLRPNGILYNIYNMSKFIFFDTVFTRKSINVYFGEDI